jgi:hypothetical protein
MFSDLDHKRGVARVLELLACLAAAQSEAESSMRLAGAAASLRHQLGAPLAVAEQAKLNLALDSVRKALSNAASSATWMEGWTTPIEVVIDEIVADTSSPSSPGTTLQ